MELPGFEPALAIGQFSNIIPLCLIIQPEDSIRTICKRTHDLLIEGKIRQQIPYLKIKQAFEANTGKILDEYIAGALNFIDYSDSEIPDSRYRTALHKKEAKHHEPPLYICKVYSNGLVITARRPENYRNSKCDFYEILDALFQQNVHSPEAPIRSLIVVQ
jgi:hypothetical protein